MSIRASVQHLLFSIRLQSKESQSHRCLLCTRARPPCSPSCSLPCSLLCSLCVPLSLPSVLLLLKVPGPVPLPTFYPWAGSMLGRQVPLCAGFQVTSDAARAGETSWEAQKETSPGSFLWTRSAATVATALWISPPRNSLDLVSSSPHRTGTGACQLCWALMGSFIPAPSLWLLQGALPSY